MKRCSTSLQLSRMSCSCPADALRRCATHNSLDQLVVLSPSSSDSLASAMALHHCLTRAVIPHSEDCVKRMAYTASVVSSDCNYEMTDNTDSFLEMFYCSIVPSLTWTQDSPKMSADELYAFLKELETMDVQTATRNVIDWFAREGRLSVAEALLCFQTLSTVT